MMNDFKVNGTYEEARGDENIGYPIDCKADDFMPSVYYLENDNNDKTPFEAKISVRPSVAIASTDEFIDTAKSQETVPVQDPDSEQVQTASDSAPQKEGFKSYCGSDCQSDMSRDKYESDYASGSVENNSATSFESKPLDIGVRGGGRASASQMLEQKPRSEPEPEVVREKKVKPVPQKTKVEKSLLFKRISLAVYLIISAAALIAFWTNGGFVSSKNSKYLLNMTFLSYVLPPFGFSVASMRHIFVILNRAMAFVMKRLF